MYPLKNKTYQGTTKWVTTFIFKHIKAQNECLRFYGKEGKRSAVAICGVFINFKQYCTLFYSGKSAIITN